MEEFLQQLRYEKTFNMHKHDGTFAILLMAEILSRYLQGFLHPRWCRISSINSINWCRISSVVGGGMLVETTKKMSRKKLTLFA